MSEYQSDDNLKIDFVLIWVDGNDIEWQKIRNKYSDNPEDISDSRYRDWGVLRYWFRSVEKYAPWVNKIHFVTCNQWPSWLNRNNPKLNCVAHSDYIPNEWLPTFSSHTIELNIHRIKGLEEHFVYFNDDMFLNAKTSPKDFFHKGIPCDCAILNPIKISGIPNIVVNNLKVIDKHFSFQSQFKNNIGKWINVKYGKLMLRTVALLPWQSFTGFYEPHTPYSFLKSTFENVWREESKLLQTVCSRRFRSDADVNQWVMRYWQLAKGLFYPRSPKFSKMYFSYGDPKLITDDIINRKHKLICINDSEELVDFELVRRKVFDAYEAMFPEKSTYEL